MDELELSRSRCLDVIDTVISKRLNDLLDNDKYADARAIAQEMFLIGDDDLDECWDDEIMFIDDITGMTDEELADLQFDVTVE